MVPFAVVRSYKIPNGFVINSSEQAASPELFCRSIMYIDDELAILEPSVEAAGSKHSELMSMRQVRRDLQIVSDAEEGLACKESRDEPLPVFQTQA
jgi:hypothetical protein